MTNEPPRRRLPVGAEFIHGQGVHFRVWAPRRAQVEVVLNGEPRSTLLQAEKNGYFSGLAAEAKPGTLYQYRFPESDRLFPDPVSRFQPDGPHGPSQVVDPSAFAWSDHGWRGAGLRGQIIYEMHIGTLTRAGTWEAAARELPELARTGVTLLEVMPVAEFPGKFGWGYDGVDLFAPTHLYGPPDDFRRFVDEAHNLGLGVILDVVYNHLGPDGNYLKEFSEHYFSTLHTTDWGEAINFDDEHAAPVREFFVANAEYWIGEFHLDGLRFDATQNIYDSSTDHILAVISRRARAAANGRSLFLVAENEPQHVQLVRPLGQGGYGLDALWNDDFHHTAAVALTGHKDAYYTDYLGSPQEFLSCAKWGFLYQGQRYSWQEKRRGTPTFGIEPAAFVNFIENHDQVANSAKGLRIRDLTSPGRYRAMTALFLLMPGTPMLFQGQEFAASSPFLFFADHHQELAKMVGRGRAEFLAQFRNIAQPEVTTLLADPADPQTFERCKLDFSQRSSHAEAYVLHQDLLKLRRQDAVLAAQRLGGVDGAVFGPQAFLLRYFGEAGDDRLLLINLGIDLHLDPAPEPLLAPPGEKQWSILWSSEHPRYGGLGTPPLDTEDGSRIPGEAAVLLSPTEASAPTRE